jgi:hypothetical protein
MKKMRLQRNLEAGIIPYSLYNDRLATFDKVLENSRNAYHTGRLFS